MPGINLTGAPNTQDYVLGKGRLYIAQINSLTGLPNVDGFRDYGNVTAFTVTVSAEDVRHKNSRDCLAFTDARVVISQEIGLGFTIDEVANFENLSDFLAGEVSTYDNPHNVTHTDVSITLDVKLGRWYELRKANGDRVYNLDATGAVYTIEKDDVADVLLAEGVDYEIDEQLGLVRFLPTSILIVDGDPIIWTITTGATTPQDVDQIDALLRADVSGTLLFVQDNAHNCGQKIEYRFHKVSLSADGDYAAIGDEFATLAMTGVAEVNSLVNYPSKVMTVRTYIMV